MEASPSDPRDHRRETAPDSYRVDFWKPLGDLNPRPLRVAVPFLQATYELAGAASVAEALDWAHANAGERTFTLYAICESTSEHMLVHLFGLNPTRDRISSKQAAEADELFKAHGFVGEPLMHPVNVVDERVFVATSEQLSATRDVDELVASLERVLEAPVRIEAVPAGGAGRPE